MSPAGSGGLPTGGTTNGQGGGNEAGAPSSAGAPPSARERCIYHTEAPPLELDAELAVLGAGAGGMSGGESAGAGGTEPVPNGGGAGGDSPGPSAGSGGEGGEPPFFSVTVRKHPILGEYLADSNGKSLYIWGPDYPGSCEVVPVSNCYLDCEKSWPIFPASPRILVDTLDDSLFGDFERTNGDMQMTYLGWPLYYYKDDVKAGDTIGHGKGYWYLAQVKMPNLLIIRIGEAKGLGDEYGYPLYVYEGDTVGTETADPVSACTGECLNDFRPFYLRNLVPITKLDLRRFSYFVRDDGELQIADRGKPLYWSNADEAPSQLNGLETPGWTMAPE
jgi:predicted lipoprotein with Yx(FWY)xxD motif